jgi:hypothetical protein
MVIAERGATIMMRTLALLMMLAGCGENALPAEPANAVVRSDDGCGGCPDSEFCELETGACDNAGDNGHGACKPRPQICVENYQPVCGCNGKTYGNDCARQAAGAQLAHAGPCN